MSKPDWTQAPTEATHYDTYADCFCDVNGWWRIDRYQILKDQNEWGTSRYTPRPTDPAPSDWVDGWPPVGWQGECRWGSSVEWFECIVIPGNQVVVQGLAGNWSVINDLKEHDYEFRDVQSEENSTANSKEWYGTGFPPVGTKCEVNQCDEWVEATIEHLLEWKGETECIFKTARDWDFSSSEDCFRLVQTQAQIEREKVINKADSLLSQSLASSEHEAAKVLYDAGMLKMPED